MDAPCTFIDCISHTNISHGVHEKYPSKNEFMLYPTLEYINQILLEEGSDEPFNAYQKEVALSDVEKSFYDILGEQYPPSPNTLLVLSQSKSNNNSNICILNNPLIQSSNSTSLSQDTGSESLLAKEFQRGVEEGKKFLPTINSTTDLNMKRILLDTEHKKKSSEIEENAHSLVDRSKARKDSSDVDLNILEGRNNKMPMLSSEETIRDEMFDKVLLYHGEEYARGETSRLRELRKFEPHLEDNIEIESLLVQCSEAVELGDNKMAQELIKELRKHASPIGSGIQRLAVILTDGLEARLAGTGSETFRQLISKRVSTRKVLKAYHTYITATPLLWISYRFANDYICKVAESSSRIHIIDLGITFGFQWPPLIQALAKSKGGAPKLRITGVDLPQPGFRPDERLKQIGVRLEEYAKSFGVPFEYQCIASSWESICVEDLKLDDKEVLVVNSMFRFKQVKDESFAINSPRNQVLNLIRHIKPKILILGIFNVSFSLYFTPRFRKVLLQFSMIFDMYDTLVPRYDEGRLIMERELLAAPIINQVACEGHDRVSRPETYKQWHKRISQAGFKQLPLDQEIVNDCNVKVKSGYHEGFFVEEESDWLLQGWKGRIHYALSVWEPKLE